MFRFVQRKEEDGTITEREAQELWHRQELHYDTMYGLFPATVLPDELKYMTTRIIFLYMQLTPPAVAYTPDMHLVLSPLLYIAMRDPDHGLRDTLLDRELHVAATGHDHVEAQAFAMLLSFSSQLLHHWAPVAGAGGQDVTALLAARILDRIYQADEELALKLFGPLGLRMSPDALVRPHLASLFAASLPLPHLLPVWEALLAAPDRNAMLVDLFLSLLTAPALRHQLMLAESPARAQLLVELPPAMPAEELLLGAARLALRLPHPPLALAPLPSRSDAMACAAAQMRALVAWGGRARRAMEEAALKLSDAARGDPALGRLGPADQVSLFPYVSFFSLFPYVSLFP
jgi:hypothetical protein